MDSASSIMSYWPKIQDKMTECTVIRNEKLPDVAGQFSKYDTNLGGLQTCFDPCKFKDSEGNKTYRIIYIV